MSFGFGPMGKRPLVATSIRSALAGWAASQRPTIVSEAPAL